MLTDSCRFPQVQGLRGLPLSNPEGHRQAKDGSETGAAVHRRSNYEPPTQVTASLD